ncbi:MAG TPA: hypothetical protein VGA95_04380 [Thermodesulfobacteriota bacterium]
MSRFIVYFVSLVAVAFVFSMPLSFAGEEMMEEKDMGKDVTITGRVVDPACYTHMGLKGPDHKGCAEMCAKAGQALGILDEKNDVLYQVIEGAPGTDPNKLIIGNAEDVITVKGKLYEKSGMKALIVTEVTEQ